MIEAIAQYNFIAGKVMNFNKDGYYLKPCPFCAKKAKLFSFVDTKSHFVECQNCFAQTAPRQTIGRAIGLWNKRK